MFFNSFFRYFLYLTGTKFILAPEGYISGIVIDQDIDENIEIYNLDKCEITPKGIEYLTDNSTIEKAKRFMKDLKDILPFV